MDPWGTPLVTCFLSQKAISQKILCPGSWMRLLISNRFVPSSNFGSDIRSKTADESKKKSRKVSVSFGLRSSLEVMEWKLLKAEFCLSKMKNSSRKDWCCQTRMLSKFSKTMWKIGKGRYLELVWISPILKIGITKPCFISSENVLLV